MKILEKINLSLQMESTMSDQMNDAREFIIPSDITKAKILHRSLRTDIKTINDQLAESNKDGNPDANWLRSAKFALRKKT